jgi:crotonobetainyl-CoA:carnitine CoA-transferase CaiB-like acyl-CoA transferase
MGPLEGKTVLDLSRYGPGRYCSMILADFGADVITVETPRFVSELPSLITDDTGARYLGQNRNKKSIALNLKKEEGRKIFYRLSEKADVILETFRPGVVKRLGVDYETVRKFNPMVVYCSISGYGQDGPYALRPGHDLNYVGLAGVLNMIGQKEGPPMYLPVQMADLAGGTSQATIAILAALIARDTTRKGQYIDVSMTDGVVFYQWTLAMMYLIDGIQMERAELPTGSDHAWMNIYKARDGKYFTVASLEPWLWANLCRMVGRQDFTDTPFGPPDRQREMYLGLSEVFATRDRDEWVKLLDEANVCVAPVCTFEETFSDPQIVHRKLVVEIDHPKRGKVKILNTPYKFSETPAQVRTRPPLYAEHTAEVLGSMLGYNDKELERLRKKQVIE